MRFVFVTVLCLGVLAPRPASATSIIDQSCCGTADSSFLFSNLTRVQSFTVGITGLMTEIDLGLNQGGSMPTFELFAGAFCCGQDISTFGSPLATLALVATGQLLPNNSQFFAASLGAGI